MALEEEHFLTSGAWLTNYDSTKNMENFSFYPFHNILFRVWHSASLGNKKIGDLCNLSQRRERYREFLDIQWKRESFADLGRGLAPTALVSSKFHPALLLPQCHSWIRYLSFLISPPKKGPDETE